MKDAWLDANVVLLDSNNKPLKRTHTNSKGYFTFKNVNMGFYKIRIDGNNIQTVYFDSINIIKDTFIVLDGFKECEYDKHRNDSICPICRKYDKVVPIEYGTIIGLFDTGLIDSTFYWGGCVVPGCGPSWYCMRDEKQF
jgi:hypothetical protein